MGALTQEQAVALVDGVARPLSQARLDLRDAGVSRGDGGFETIGVWDGRPFRLEDHLDRLDRTLRSIALAPAPLPTLREECARLLEGVTADAALRIYLTASGTRIVTLSDLPERPPVQTLVPQSAPWIQPVSVHGMAGAKTMSYGANMVATRRAVQFGGDDALLLSVPDGLILEGPTFGVVLVAHGVLHAPDPDLGIIDSISRRTVLEIAVERGMDVLLGRWTMDMMEEVDEVLICSSLRDVAAISQVGAVSLDRAHPVADLLRGLVRERRRGPEPMGPATAP